MGRSFGSRLALTLGAVGVAAAAATALIFNVIFESRFELYVDSQTVARQIDVVDAREDSYRTAGAWRAEELDDLAPTLVMDGAELRVLDDRGREVWDSNDYAGGELTRVHEEMMTAGPLGPEARLPLSVAGDRVGTAEMRLPQAGVLPHDIEFRDSVNQALFVAGVSVAVIAILGGVLVARRATRPARALTAAAALVAAGDRTTRVPEQGPVEFEEMGRAFNAMAVSLDREDQLRRRFAADVAHELRTPLAILQSSIEGMQDGVLARDDDQVASLHDEVRRLTRLVGDLEAVADADAAGFSLDLAPVQLDRLAAQACTDIAGAFAAEGITLRTDLSPATVSGDAVRLRQVLDNVLSNALKFTAGSGEVEVVVRVDEGDAVLTVTDSGVGIRAEDLEQVFERFYRGGNARAKGSGIGLTVVRELVAAHNGEVSIESELGHGTAVTVRLPLASDDPGEGVSRTEPLVRAPAHP
jgi:two-component system sensor histidine kinase BaeS